MVKRLSTMWETWVRSLGREYPLEKEMAPHSSTLAWKIPWMEEPGGPQSMGSQSRTRLSDFTFVLSFSPFVIGTFKLALFLGYLPLLCLLLPDLCLNGDFMSFSLQLNCLHLRKLPWPLSLNNWLLLCTACSSSIMSMPCITLWKILIAGFDCFAIALSPPLLVNFQYTESSVRVQPFSSWLTEAALQVKWCLAPERNTVAAGPSLGHVRCRVTPQTAARQAPRPTAFPRQEYQTGLPLPSPGDLPNPGKILPAMAGEFSTTEPPGKPKRNTVPSVSWVSINPNKGERLWFEIPLQQKRWESWSRRT